jgi:hypothetical protein
LYRNSYEFFKKKQNELEKYHFQLKEYRKVIKQVFKRLDCLIIFLIYSNSTYKYQFNPSPLKFVQGQLGEFEDGLSIQYIKYSLILTKEEIFSIVEMAQFKDGNLLYRATRDGFTVSAFHEKCDEKDNTITIIKTDGNYVFGGYTAAKWTSEGAYMADTKAFIFSVRRKGISCNHKFMIKDANYAIFGHRSYGPRFGVGGYSGNDIEIKDKSNINIGSSTKLGTSYHYPPDNVDSKLFLAGTYDGWLTTEIEVYQMV